MIKAPIEIIIIDVQFLIETYSLKKQELNKMVVNGLAKNTKPEIKGLVIFKPKKLHKIAARITALMIIILLNRFLIKFTISFFL